MEEQQVDLNKVKPVENKGVDLWKFDKKEVIISKIEVLQVPSKFTAKIENTEKNYPQWILKISSEVLETLEREEEEENIEFRASELFNLIQNNKGELEGFPTGESSNLMKFMKDLKINSPDKLENLQKVKEEILEKKALVKAYDKESEGKTKTYLKFRY